MSTALDNPAWSSLTSAHAHFARRRGEAARYPADVAPFVATATDERRAGVDLAGLVDIGEAVLFVGPAPPLDANWQLAPTVHIAQMVCTERLAEIDGPAIVALSPAQRADVLDLTARVYPHYFRPRTPELGRYFGIYDGAKLAAMIGERMRCDGYRELSAICTDPAYLGRRLAQRLVAMLTNDILDAGELPFLHVSHENTRAKRLYEYLGYRFRVDIPLVSALRLC